MNYQPSIALRVVSGLAIFVMVICMGGFLIAVASDVGDADAGIDDTKARTEDGRYRVGVDIEPGTYTSTTDGYCYTHVEDTTDSIIDDLLSRSLRADQTVVLTSDTEWFEHHNCGDWEKVS